MTNRNAIARLRTASAWINVPEAKESVLNTRSRANPIPESFIFTGS
jgi:hypothetical protein